MNCNNCPRNCHVDRKTQLGFCHASFVPEVASIAIHKGEEPPISGERGICNIFFAHCNLQCCYCQNYDISRGNVNPDKIFYSTLDAIVDRVEALLARTENMVGFVSPSHYTNWIPRIVEALHARGLYPTTVYNTNGYDSVETLQQLAPYIDIYLPDFKYMDSNLALRYSNAVDYPQRAQEALLEMYKQKGSGLPLDEHKLAFRGMVVRHLVLPGQVQNSIDCLRWIADNLSPNLHISLMAQYFPPEAISSLPDELDRVLTPCEYQAVVDVFYELGFIRGWVQDLTAATNYHPDFSQRQSFE